MGKTLEAMTEDEIDNMIAENQPDVIETAEDANNYEEKRTALSKTRITKQIWSVAEIFRKMKLEELNISPDYQRNVVWTVDKKSAFIESLFMGIAIPPIYVVEVPVKSETTDTTYEVVDGKQRLTAIREFLYGNYKLKKSALEYYGDIFGGKNYNEIEQEHSSLVTDMKSFVIDVFVITANSPILTKFDIFARLNRGAEELKANEIRRAVYYSEKLRYIETYSNEYKESKPEIYNAIFSKTYQKRYSDLGRFYRSVAYYNKTNKESLVVENYNSRPKEMINSVLSDIQNDKIKITEEELKNIIDQTINLLQTFNDHKVKDLLVDVLIPYVNEDIDLNCVAHKLLNSKDFLESTVTSPSTTANVNKRVKIVSDTIRDFKHE